MDRQTTIAFILIGAILMVWLYVSAPTPPPNQTPQTKSDSTGTTEVIKDSVKDIPPVVEKEIIKSDEKNIFSSSKNEKVIIVENELLRLEITTRGANIRRCFVKKFNNWYSIDQEEGKNIERDAVQLINYSRSNGFDLAFVTSEGKAINTANLDFETYSQKTKYLLAKEDSQKIVFTFKAEDGSRIIKTFVFYGNKYSFTADVEMAGMQSHISNNAYDLVWDGGIRFAEENSVDEANYSNASAFYGDEQVIVDASDAGTKVEKDFSGKVNWVAVRNKYFSVIIAPQKPEQVEGAFINGSRELLSDHGVKEFYSTRLILPYKNTASEKHSFTIYMGPVDYDILKTYSTNFEAIVDFGSFFGLKFIVRPIAEFVMLPLFNFLHTFIPNFGFVIIVFSLIIKVFLYPLTKSSMQSMKKMQLLQPKMAEIKEKYKDDPSKANTETMKLYSTYGINPAGGCFPLLLQMPIFIALWGLFQVAIELRQQPFIFWIDRKSVV